MPLMFVYGTLKRSFPLHERGLEGVPFLGEVRTVERFPMVVAGPRFGPMMLNQPGEGLQVNGELYDVPDDRVPRIDELESVGKPGHLRATIDVQLLDGGPVRAALAYPKAAELAVPRHTGWLDDYQDRRFEPE